LREDSNDPLATFFTSEDPAGSLEQIVVEFLNGGAEPLQNYLISGRNVGRYQTDIRQISGRYRADIKMKLLEK